MTDQPLKNAIRNQVRTRLHPLLVLLLAACGTRSPLIMESADDDAAPVSVLEVGADIAAPETAPYSALDAAVDSIAITIGDQQYVLTENLHTNLAPRGLCGWIFNGLSGLARVNERSALRRSVP